MKAYLVYYQVQDIDWDVHDRFIFVTTDKYKAKRYIDKANKLVKNWKEYFALYDFDNNYKDCLYRRYERIDEVMGFDIREIELR